MIEQVAGANLDNGDSQLLVYSLRRYLRFLPPPDQARLAQELQQAA